MDKNTFALSSIGLCRRCTVTTLDNGAGSTAAAQRKLTQYVGCCYFVFLRFVSDGTIAILMSMLFFAIPSQLPRFGGYGYDKAGEMFIWTPLKNPYFTVIFEFDPH